ncbi:MAG TPA: hypothetical protein VHG93_12315 [Longimicrobium sp.]|nr:hypothetical protein [Longimicrobium sp.]
MSDGEWTAADDAVEEVREVRGLPWECFGNDPAKYGAFLRDLGEQLVRDGLARGPLIHGRGNSPPD